MAFLLLLLVFLLYVQNHWLGPWAAMSAGESLGLHIAGIGVFVLLAAGLSLYFRRALWHAPHLRLEAARRLRTICHWHFLGMLAFFLASLYLLGWGWAVESLLGDRLKPLVKPAILLPLLIGHVLAWAFFYEPERIVHELGWMPGDSPFLTRRAYLLLHVRHTFLLMLPPLLLMTSLDFLEQRFPELGQREDYPIFSMIVLACMMGVSVLIIPYILKWFLGLTPLPPGAVRDHLTATARRLGFRFTDILVWDTRGAIANAMVTGMLPMHRYIVLTDRLLGELSLDEIEAVFGHEVGHVKHHHMTFYMVFLVLSLMVLGSIWSWGSGWLHEQSEALGPWLGRDEWFLGMVVVYVFLAFGFLSRHCERQADLFGCYVASPDAFARALEKVADMNGMRREKPGWFTAWQHCTIGERVAFVRRLELEPGLAAGFHRRLALMKWGVTLVLLGIIAAMVSVHPWGWLKYL